MRNDRLVLTLLLREFCASLRVMRRYDLAWIALGGAGLVAYAMADIIVALQAAAGTLRRFPWLLSVGVPGTALLLGFASGLAVGRLTLSRAFAPFLKALPVSMGERRRMATVAAFSIGILPVAATGCVTSLTCALIAKPHPLAWGLVTAALFAVGFGTGLSVRFRAAFRSTTCDGLTSASPADAKRRHVVQLGALDRARPAWLGSWAWNLSAGYIWLTWRFAGGVVALGGAAILAISASLAQHQPGPATLAGLAGGLAVFMLSLRCHPLSSPALRTAPISFTRVWLRLLRLPLQLSLAFFVLSAGAAIAVEPSPWPLPIAGGLWLLALDGVYAVFAAYFMTAPLAAAFSFLAAIVYTSFESMEYGRTVLIGLAALVLWLWHRARLRFYHG